SRRDVFDDEIHMIAGGHFLEIKARFPATLFLAGNRTLNVTYSYFCRNPLRWKPHLRQGTGLDQVDAKVVISGILGSLEHLPPPITVNHGTGIALSGSGWIPVPQV